MSKLALVNKSNCELPHSKFSLCLSNNWINNYFPITWAISALRGSENYVSSVNIDKVMNFRELGNFACSYTWLRKSNLLKPCSTFASKYGIWMSIFHLFQRRVKNFSVPPRRRAGHLINFITYVCIYLFKEYVLTVRLIPTMHGIFMRRVLTFCFFFF